MDMRNAARLYSQPYTQHVNRDFTRFIGDDKHEPPKPASRTFKLNLKKSLNQARKLNCFNPKAVSLSEVFLKVIFTLADGLCEDQRP